MNSLLLSGDVDASPAAHGLMSSWFIEVPARGDGSCQEIHSQAPRTCLLATDSSLARSINAVTLEILSPSLVSILWEGAFHRMFAMNSLSQ